MTNTNKRLLDIGDLIEDNISGKRGVVLEIKKWSYSIDLRDVYIHWTDGEKFWISSDEITIISKSDGNYNKIIETINTKHDLVTTIVPKAKDD